VEEYLVGWLVKLIQQTTPKELTAAKTDVPFKWIQVMHCVLGVMVLLLLLVKGINSFFFEANNQ